MTVVQWAKRSTKRNWKRVPLGIVCRICGREVPTAYSYATHLRARHAGLTSRDISHELVRVRQENGWPMFRGDEVVRLR